MVFTLLVGFCWVVRCLMVRCSVCHPINSQGTCKSPVQIILRWHIQGDFSVIPGASNLDYIKENIAIFDFELNNKKMEQMCSLNKEKRFFNATQEEVEKMVWNTEH